LTAGLSGSDFELRQEVGEGPGGPGEAAAGGAQGGAEVGLRKQLLVARQQEEPRLQVRFTNQLLPDYFRPNFSAEIFGRKNYTYFSSNIFPKYTFQFYNISGETDPQFRSQLM
jgi:hypothetical protein